MGGCRSDGGHEDVEVAKCLRQQGVYAGKALDKYDRELFHPLPFQTLFSGNLPDWMYSYAENPTRKVRRSENVPIYLLVSFQLALQLLQRSEHLLSLYLARQSVLHGFSSLQSSMAKTVRRRLVQKIQQNSAGDSRSKVEFGRQMVDLLLFAFSQISL